MEHEWVDQTQNDMLTQLEYKNIVFLLVSEAHLTPNHNTMLKNYGIYSTSHPHGTARAGTAKYNTSNYNNGAR